MAASVPQRMVSLLQGNAAPAYLTPTSYPRVYTLVLNRPAAHNALSRALLSAFSATLDEAVRLQNSGQLSVLIIRGEGSGCFCSGADLKERAGMSQADVLSFLQHLTTAFSTLDGSLALCVPTIAALDGPALGGGLELALACDFRVASTSSKAFLSLPETRLAIIPGAGGTQRLPMIVGPTHAKDMIFTGRRVSVQEAYGWGLVSHLASDGQTAYERALELAGEISKGAPMALRMAKHAMSHSTLHGSGCAMPKIQPFDDRYDKVVVDEEDYDLPSPSTDSTSSVFTPFGSTRNSSTSSLPLVEVDVQWDTPLSRALACEREAYKNLLPSLDRLEGLAAWREKREPVWMGC